MFVAGIINTVEIGIFSKEMCRFSNIFIKFPAAFFIELYKVILKFIHRHKRPGLAGVAEQKQQCWGLHKGPISSYSVVTSHT